MGKCYWYVVQLIIFSFDHILSTFFSSFLRFHILGMGPTLKPEATLTPTVNFFAEGLLGIWLVWVLVSCFLLFGLNGLPPLCIEQLLLGSLHSWKLCEQFSFPDQFVMPLFALDLVGTVLHLSLLSYRSPWFIQPLIQLWRVSYPRLISNVSRFILIFISPSVFALPRYKNTNGIL